MARRVPGSKHDGRTYWYFESTPELMADMAQCTEACVYGDWLTADSFIC